MPMPAAKASDPRPKKCWLLTLHPPVKRVSNGYLCHPLPVPNVAYVDFDKKIKNPPANACVPNGYLRSKTQKMLPNVTLS